MAQKWGVWPILKIFFWEPYKSQNLYKPSDGRIFVPDLFNGIQDGQCNGRRGLSNVSGGTIQSL